MVPALTGTYTAATRPDAVTMLKTSQCDVLLLTLTGPPVLGKKDLAPEKDLPPEACPPEWLLSAEAIRSTSTLALESCPLSFRENKSLRAPRVRSISVTTTTLPICVSGT